MSKVISYKHKTIDYKACLVAIGTNSVTIYYNEHGDGFKIITLEEFLKIKNQYVSKNEAVFLDFLREYPELVI